MNQSKEAKNNFKQRRREAHFTVIVIRPMCKRIEQTRSSTNTRKQLFSNNRVAVIADGQNHLPLIAVYKITSILLTTNGRDITMM